MLCSMPISTVSAPSDHLCYVSWERLRQRFRSKRDLCNLSLHFCRIVNSRCRFPWELLSAFEPYVHIFSFLQRCKWRKFANNTVHAGAMHCGVVGCWPRAAYYYHFRWPRGTCPCRFLVSVVYACIFFKPLRDGVQGLFLQDELCKEDKLGWPQQIHRSDLHTSSLVGESWGDRRQ